jgi:magnesium transporter
MIRSKLARGSALTADLTWDQMRAFLAARDGVLWVDLEGPTEEEYAILADVFAFHPLAVEDARKEIDLPKVDAYEGYVYLVVHRINVDLETRRVAPREMDIFLSDRYLVTVHDEVSASVGEVAARIAASPAILEGGPDLVMHEIIDRIVDRYLPVLDRWEGEIDDLEEAILTGSRQDGVLEDALRLRHEIAELR